MFKAFRLLLLSFFLLLILFKKKIFAHLCAKRSNFCLESIKPKISYRKKKIKLEIQIKKYVIREKVRELTMREKTSKNYVSHSYRKI